MKAADIPDEAFLAAIDVVHRDRWGSSPTWIGASIWDIACVLDGHPEWVGQHEATDGVSVRIPEKAVRAKAKKLIVRGLVGGCAGGCRGDFTRVLALPETAEAR